MEAKNVSGSTKSADLGKGLWAGFSGMDRQGNSPDLLGNALPQRVWLRKRVIAGSCLP